MLPMVFYNVAVHRRRVKAEMLQKLPVLIDGHHLSKSRRF